MQSSSLKVNEYLEALLQMQVEVSYDDSSNTKPINLRDYVTPNVLNQIAIKLVMKLGMSNQDKVTEFNDTFKVQREHEEEVVNFTTKDLRLQLIVEEMVELAFALGFGELSLKHMIKEKINKVYNKPPFSDNGEKLVETFDALIDLLYVTYGALDAFNMADKTEAGMQEVHSSNMSKVCDNSEVLQATVQKYKEEGITLVTEQLPNGKYIVKHNETKKVLKSINYRPASLKSILFNL